jgi:hypothetical protein
MGHLRSELMDAERLDRPNKRTVEYRLWQFAILCNKESPHPLDWRRFYLFVVYAHQRRVGWDEFDIREKLKTLGFDEKNAMDLSNAYWHIRCALYMTKPRPMNASFHDWMRDGGTSST